MTFAFLLASIIAALASNLPRDLLRYFLAQLVYTIVTQSAIRILGSKSPVFAAIYSIFTLLIICAMLGIIAPKMKKWNSVLMSWMVGVLVSLICFFALPRPIPYYKIIGLLEGMTLATCGTFLIYNTRKPLYLSLAVLWLSLAGFRLCFALEMARPGWQKANWIVPAAMCSATFFGIGWFNRRKRLPA